MFLILERLCIVAMLAAAFLAVPRIERLVLNYAQSHIWFRRVLLITAWVIGVLCGFLAVTALIRLSYWVWTGKIHFWSLDS
jgi:hypothetical protein